MKYEIEIDCIPDLYEPVRFGVPKRGELFIDSIGGVQVCDMLASPRIVLRECAKYREPVLPADAGKTARFSDNASIWATGTLVGWLESSPSWQADINGERDAFKYCEVQDV